MLPPSKFQGLKSGSGFITLKAFWMTEEHMRSAEHQVKTAGLKLITKPYIGDVAREISRPR